MIREGNYEEYRQLLNAKRRERLAEKKRAMAIKGWKEHQKAVYAKRAESQRRKRWNWLEEQLDRPFPLPWLPLEWSEPDHEENTVQTLRANALEQMDQYL